MLLIRQAILTVWTKDTVFRINPQIVSDREVWTERVSCSSLICQSLIDWTLHAPLLWTYIILYIRKYVPVSEGLLCFLYTFTYCE